MNLNTSFTLQTDLSNIQTSPEQGATTGKPVAPGAPTNNANANSNTSASASQGGQNINATLGQALGTAQNSSLDSSSTDNSFDSHDLSSSDNAPQIVNTELSPDKQITGRQGSRGGKDSGTGGQSGNSEVYMETAATGLQKGQGARSSTSVDLSHSVAATFTLKIESSESTSVTSSTESITYTDSNGAASLPPPNVYDMVANCGELSSNLGLQTLDQMTSSTEAMNNTLSEQYTQEIADTHNYLNELAHAKGKSKTLGILSEVLASTMIVAGCLTMQPELAIGGAAMLAMAKDPQIASGLTNAMSKIMPKEAAAIIAPTVICLAAVACGAGISSVAQEAFTTGAADAAAAGAESGTEASTEDTASMLAETAEEAKPEVEAGDVASDDATASAKNAAKVPKEKPTFSETMKLISENQEARTAFFQGAKRGAWSAVKNAPSYMAKSIASTPGSIAKGIGDAGSALASIPSSLAEGLNNLYLIATRLGSGALSSGSRAATESADLSASFANTEEGIEMSTFSTNMPKEEVAAATTKTTTSLEQRLSTITSYLTSPTKALQVSANLIVTSLGTAEGVTQFKATSAEVAATHAESKVLSSQASTTDISAQIQMANTQITDVLRGINSYIISASNSLSNMSSLSSETLGQLTGAA